MIWNWEHFKPEEVLSPDALKLWESAGICLVSPKLLALLSVLRDSLNKTLLINHAGLRHRGFRSYVENLEVGGKPHSMHLLGLAADVTVTGMSQEDLAKAAEEEGFSGIGIYPTFVHMDVRYTPGRKLTKWEGYGGSNLA